MIDIVAIVSCFILAGLAIFQLALVCGAPIGKYAWGGQHMVLPTNLRIGSGIAILLYGIFATIMLSKVGIIVVFDQEIVNTAAWALAVYFYTGVLLNGVSRSKPERNLMTPLTLVLAIMATFIALS